MTERNVSKKTRFEVFKRDAFACVYCGRGAPSVVLHCDHLDPLANDGGNEITNLVTSCGDCNLGKGATLLSDNSAVTKQRAALEEQNERRVQLQMLLEWRAELRAIDDQYLKALDDAVRNACGDKWRAAESSVIKMRGWLKKYPLAELLDAVDQSFSTYWKPSDDERAERRSWGLAFSKIPAVLEITRATAHDPHLRDALYVRAILRNRGCLQPFENPIALAGIKFSLSRGIPLEKLKAEAKQATNWPEFDAVIADAIEGLNL